MIDEDKIYRIAIIGIGAIANMHARAIGDIKNAVLVAGTCSTQGKGEIFAERFKCKWYESNLEMLEQEHPDIVTVCTPSGAHLEIAMDCLNLGIHVLVEKPLEVSLARVDQMIEAAGKSSALLGGIFPQRFNPVVKAVHEAAAKGRFGSVATINSYVPWWRDERYYAPHRWQGTKALDGGGAMMNQSIHGVDLVQWLAGAAIKAKFKDKYDEKLNPVAEVYAYTAQRGHDPKSIEVEDTCVAVLKFRDGSLGQLLGSTAMFPGTLRRIQIGGRDGTAEIVEDQLTKFSFRDDQIQDSAIRETYGKPTQTGGGASDPMAIDYANHTRNIQGFIDAIHNRTPFALDGAEARKAVAIIEAIYQSAETGKPVKVK